MADPWDKLYQIHSGCCYATFCSPCATCEIAEFLGESGTLDKFGCVGQTISSCIATPLCPLTICLCRSWIQPCYNTDLTTRLARRLEKDMSTFGCHGESECCGANCNFLCPHTVMCVHCLVYAEMKKARAIHGNGLGSGAGSDAYGSAVAGRSARADSMERT
mmetsp:Transcript_12981/g.33275  ORF Transcript_12981/g.33275 Transcript_12981/m.33275 type:complete len:162 (+) Transcript_12981:47-532(+)